MISGLMGMRAIDFLDVLLVAFIIYWLLLFIRGTRAVQILLGLVVLLILYVVSKKAGMVTSQWLVGNFLGNLLVVLVVIFQSEIRRALARIGQWHMLGPSHAPPDPSVLEEIGRSAFLLAGKRVGAILLLEREIGLEDFVEHGRKLDAVFSGDLVESIFSVSSPIHDGAAVIRGNRIEAAGIILPIPSASLETQGMGTRHRAAFGIAAETDAVAVVVSEETGKVTVFDNRTVRRPESTAELRGILGRIFAGKGGRMRDPDLVSRIRRVAGRNLPLRLLALGLAITAWWFVAGESKVLVGFNVPLEIRNVPRGLTLTNQVERVVEVRLQGPSSLLTGFKASDISMALDLSNGRMGRQTVKIDPHGVKVPPGIQVQRIFPQAVDVVLDRTERRSLPVSLRVKGGKIVRSRIRSVEIDPSEIEVEALPAEFSRMPVAYTEEIELEPDAGVFTTAARVELRETHAKIIGNPTVRVKVYFRQ